MKLTRLLLVAALLPACPKTDSEQPKTEQPTSKPASVASKPTIGAEAAEPTPAPARADDADRKSKNGRLEAEIGGVPVIVQYGRPTVRGRTIFDDLVPYGKVWRTGADEATTLTLGKAARVAGKKVDAGTYALFSIPEEGDWKVILNSTAKQWGAYKYDESKDVLRAKVKATTHAHTEELTFAADEGALTLAWADVLVRIPIAAQ